MADEKVRCVVKPEFETKDGKKVPVTAIPVPLIDVFSGEAVEFNPDAIVTRKYAESLVKTNGQFEIIDDKAKVSKADYVIRKDYRKNEFQNRFEELTPDERDVVLEFMTLMVKGKEEKEEGFVQNWIDKVRQLWKENPVKANVKTDTGTANKKDN